MENSKRLQKIPPYLFAEISRKINAAKERGVDVISLGIGDPDLPTPEPIVKRMQEAVTDAANHQYPAYEGSKEFRQAVADWYQRRHNVSLNPDTQVLTLIGAKEASLHLCLGFVNPGDYTLCPDPTYTPYRTGTWFAGGEVHNMPLLEKNGFLPDLNAIPQDVREKSKIIFVNYPNNPTGAVANEEFYKGLIDFARDNNLIVASDNPYSEIGYDGYKPLSFLEVPGAMDVGVEFNSLSKYYNMTGWRLGMAVGNEDVIAGMATVKSNIDSGQFTAVQQAGITALNMPDSYYDDVTRVYQQRRDVMIEALRAIGLVPHVPKSALYVWCRVPEGHTSASFAELVLEKAGVVVGPGAGYGDAGEGFFRISLTVPDERLREAAKRIEESLK